MELYKIVTIIVIGLSIAVQGINLATSALGYINYHNFDAAAGTTGFWDAANGYVIFGFVAASISTILYAIILVCKIIDKSLGVTVDLALF